MIGVFESQRHGGDLSGAEIRRKPLGRRRLGIRDFHPRMIFGIGDVESPISSFGQFKNHRAGNVNQGKQAGGPRQTAASVRIEQGLRIADGLIRHGLLPDPLVRRREETRGNGLN